jgi:protein-disulfide isomerase
VSNLSRKQLLIGLVALAVIALGIVGYRFFFSGSSPAALSSDSSKFGIVLTSRDRSLGSPSAPILMVEYAAPTCPVCAAFDMQIFPQLKKNYIDTGKVHYVFRVFPLQAADVAAEAIARCLPTENYFSFIDLLYRNQSKWDPDGYDIPDVRGALVQMGGIAGMNAQEVNACIDDTAEQTRATQIGQEAQTKYNINATPSFIVNGQTRVGVSTWDEWQDYLNKLLAKK